MRVRTAQWCCFTFKTSRVVFLIFPAQTERQASEWKHSYLLLIQIFKLALLIYQQTLFCHPFQRERRDQHLSLLFLMCRIKVAFWDSGPTLQCNIKPGLLIHPFLLVWGCFVCFFSSVLFLFNATWWWGILEMIGIIFLPWDFPVFQELLFCNLCLWYDITQMFGKMWIQIPSN